MNNNNKHENKNFVFRFPLHPGSERKNPIDDPVTDMIREQIQNILEIVRLTYKGKHTDVDGFSYICNPERIYELFPKGPAAGTCKIAGLPKPTGCV